MDDQDALTQHLRPTATRPLLGMTVLVVEDSRYACDAMRLLCLKSGARIRRADCLASARRHLKVYRPSVAVIDLGLPDGDGAELIQEMAQASPRIEGILGMSGDSFAQDVALAAGADGFLAKPLTSLAAFQTSVLEALPPERRLKGPRLVNDDSVTPDPLAFRDDMAHVADVLESSEDGGAIDYVTQFLSGVAKSAGDTPLKAAADRLAQARADGKPHGGDMARLSALVQQRLAQQVAI